MYQNPAVAGTPTTEQYKKALFSLKERGRIREDVFNMLRVHYQSKDHTAHAKEIAGKLKLPYIAVNRDYGNFAKVLIRELNIYIPEGWIRLNVLATCKDEDPIWWIMHPQVVSALKELKWFEPLHELDIFQEIEDYKRQNPSETTREAIILSRIGQGQFRSDLIRYWKGCAVTGCTAMDVLKASHIKPWRFSSDVERLDLYNGLLLTPNLDSLFDGGLISFEDNGCIICSPHLSQTDLDLLGIKLDMKVEKLDEKHRSYLEFHREFHRENIFGR